MLTLKADLHIHTRLSNCCLDDRMTIENITENAKKRGLKTVGITNHLWDDAFPNKIKFYNNQNVAHVLEIKKEMPCETNGVRLLIGCEAEYQNFMVGITRENAQKFDYIMVPHSHTHMKPNTMPADCESPESIAKYLKKSFEGVVLSGMANVIAHPFYPLHYTQIELYNEIMNNISDKEFGELCAMAKEHNVAIEINGHTVTNNFETHPLIRFFNIAREVGCKFTTGSDSHSIEMLDGISNCLKISKICGIHDEMMMEL